MLQKRKLFCFNLSPCCGSHVQATSKTLAQQEEQLKKIETISALQETNRTLKMDREKLGQELQQAQAKVRLFACRWFVPCLGGLRFLQCRLYLIVCQDFWGKWCETSRYFRTQ